jgi:short-subunit dehydrogenase involved in D-alanine esterification of teichoic acids
MVHKICTTRSCKLIAEKVYKLFPNINILINNGKKIFLILQNKISIFRDEMENIPLPPVLVITR